MKYLLIFILFSANIAANEENKVIATLWHELGHPPFEKEKKAVKPKNPFFKKLSKEKKLSPGQRKIEEIKARNRKLIQQKKVESHAPQNIYQEYRQGLTEMKKRTNSTLQQYKDKIKKTRLEWKREREQFLKNIPKYKDATFEIESASVATNSTPLKLLPKNMNLSKGRDYYVIKNAFDIRVKDQGKRPTCSAFAGASAIEVLLRQNGSSIDVSEQYLYWASKPYCQKSPCKKRGSWISYAYDQSIQTKSYNIPTLQDCPYQKISQAGNETQIPLDLKCKIGKVKVDDYKSINSSSQLFTSINADHPVIVGVKLSPNFYTTTGIITYQDSLVGGKMDQHANGHALLIVGYLKLPSKLSSEGKLCYLTVNSWTKGWGAGGYGCITEKWLSKYKVRNPFMALTKVRSL